jgi:hypothetical protein
MATTIKEMILKFTYNEGDNTYNRTITDLRGNIVVEYSHEIFTVPESEYKEFFDAWEFQMKQIPCFNIVQVERFV